MKFSQGMFNWKYMKLLQKYFSSFSKPHSNKHEVNILIKIWFWALSQLGTWKICFGHTFGIYTIFFLHLSSDNQTDAFLNLPYGIRFCTLLITFAALSCCLLLNMLPNAFNLLIGAGGVDFSFSPICKNHNPFIKLLLLCI